MQTISTKDYITALKKRGSKARVTQQFQFIGLEIAAALKDLAHKAIYIKYAKEFGGEKMLALAKDIASRRDVKNPGAYFMRVVQSLDKDEEERKANRMRNYEHTKKSRVIDS